MKPLLVRIVSAHLQRREQAGNTCIADSAIFSSRVHLLHADSVDHKIYCEETFFRFQR